MSVSYTHLSGTFGKVIFGGINAQSGFKIIVELMMKHYWSLVYPSYSQQRGLWATAIEMRENMSACTCLLYTSGIVHVYP